MYYYVGRFVRGVDLLATIAADVATTQDSWGINSDATVFVENNNTLPVSARWQALAYSEELDVFCTFPVGQNESYITDDLGVTWTASAANAIPTSNGVGICWSPEVGKFCIVPVTGTDVALSADGLVWTGHTHTAFGARVCDPIWAGGSIQKFVCADHAQINVLSTTQLFYSSDGETWTNITPFGSPTNAMLTSLCYSPDRDEILIVTGLNSAATYARKAWISNDAITWNSYTIAAQDIPWSKVIWSKRIQKYVAIAGFNGAGSVNSDVCGTSSDGQTWTLGTMPASRKWRALAETGKCLVALQWGETDAENCAVSTDGLTWEYRDMGGSAEFWGNLAAKENV